MYDVEMFPTKEYEIECGVKTYESFFTAKTDEISFLKDKISVKVVFSNKVDAENFYSRDYLENHIDTISISNLDVLVDVKMKNIDAVLSGNVIYFNMKL